MGLLFCGGSARKGTQSQPKKSAPRRPCLWSTVRQRSTSYVPHYTMLSIYDRSTRKVEPRPRLLSLSATIQPATESNALLFELSGSEHQAIVGVTSGGMISDTPGLVVLGRFSYSSPASTARIDSAYSKSLVNPL